MFVCLFIETGFFFYLVLIVLELTLDQAGPELRESPVSAS